MGTMTRAAWTRGRARTPGRKLRRLRAQRALGESRIVIGIDADEAEYLAGLLDRDECAQRGQQVPPQPGPLPSGPLPQVKLTEPALEGTGEYPSSALLGAPVPFGRGRQSPIRPGT